MKIGFQLNFLDFRNDVRRVINLISRDHKVVVFIKATDIDIMKTHIPPQIEVRVIDEEIKSLRNTFWRILFSKFGKIPKSVNNFYLMERFLIYLNSNRLRRLKELLIFDLSIKLPKCLSYDLYLDNLECSRNTKIDDIDKFICLTRISDDFLFSRLIKEKKIVQVYVYSWDHACKHMQFSKRVKYLVWNKDIKDDLIELQAIPSEKVECIGASQLCYAQEFLSHQSNTFEKPYSFNYIYFGCFAGIPEMVRQEIDIIKQIGVILKEVKPQMMLVVRPYPVLQDWSFYDSLAGISNIVIDDSFKTKDLSTSEHKIIDKFLKIHFSNAFFHLGTTMGLEACFTKTPSFIIDFGYGTEKRNKLNIKHGIHQYQNEKYLIKNGNQKNVIHSTDYLKQILSTLENPDYINLNKHISECFDLISFETFAKRIAAS